MKKKLVIVESPSKSFTISKYLGNDYMVIATKGHIIDLPEDELGVDIQNSFEPDFKVMRGKNSVINSIKKLSKESSEVFLATDPDREGEAISYHIQSLIKSFKVPVHRVLFKEITKKEVTSSILNKMKLRVSLVESQFTRRIVDRLVGYTLSPFLWRKLKSGLSAGRVQTVVLAWICNREREIKSFVPKEFFKVQLSNPTKKLEFDYTNPTKKEPKRIDTEKDLEQVLNTLGFPKLFIGKDNCNIQLKVQEVLAEPKKIYPPHPFTTSSLQQEANKLLGLTSQKTMSLAQKLYEGVNCGEYGYTGLITYMRTDSTRISPEAASFAHQFISQQYGKEYCGNRGVSGGNKSTNSQDAHEAIRPANIHLTPEALKPYLSADIHKLYSLIWTRFLASRMEPENGTNYTVRASYKDTLWEATGRETSFLGFKILYTNSLSTTPLKSIQKGDVLTLNEILVSKDSTQPPPRYTESSLVKKMESTGVGRPSTFSSTIEVLLKREYISRVKKELVPTDLGFSVYDILFESFPEYTKEDMTSNLELALDEIEAGTKKRLEVVKLLYEDLNKNLSLNQYSKKASSNKQTKATCPTCNKGSLQTKYTSAGKKYSICSEYPYCDYMNYNSF